MAKATKKSLLAVYRSYQYQIQDYNYFFCEIHMSHTTLKQVHVLLQSYKLSDEGESGSSQILCSYLTTRSRVRYDTKIWAQENPC